ncbi:unnamed protein product [Rotaria sp. Silwood1]|nr:unnamed protein product [Rotaria sp. Silwood1]CAF1483088.1 unnamed protein product [Rotaria sp. Silwood1]CAF3552767.1 unnamed protein product [Rotaria sp. Silwood1]CAF3689626.1 unnamed protein product [Rotaria sp. Silwood1]CAF4604509.1 unnamed protein product [Rotaria sp. Silwood1]
MPLKLIVKFLTYTIINIAIVQGQGGGGSGGGGGGGGGGGWIPGGGGSGGGCLTHQCKYDGLVIGLVFGVIAGVCLLGFAGFFLLRCLLGRPFRTNPNFIKTAAYDKMLETDSNIIFQSGIWSSRYYQYKRWHGPHQLSLKFDALEMTVNGTGRDDVGQYQITGIYSTKTQRLGLTKKYQSGTGNSAQNLGHNVTIQLYWNPNSKQFEGKWYVQTAKYHGEDKFELKLSKQQLTNIYLKV